MTIQIRHILSPDRRNTALRLEHMYESTVSNVAVLSASYVAGIQSTS